MGWGMGGGGVIDGGTYWKISFVIVMDHSSVHENENEGGRCVWGGGGQ